MGRRRKVTLPDGLAHVVVVVIDGQIQDPMVCVDAMDAMAFSASVVDHLPRNPTPRVQMGTFKVVVTPSGRDAAYGEDS